MHLSRHLRALGIAFVAASCLPASAQTPCSTTAITAATSKVAQTQHHLASIKMEDMDVDVPPAIQQDTTLLKKSLATAAQAILACEPIDATPSTLQNALAKALSANAPESPNAVSFAWGGDLQVNVEQTSAPRLLLIQLQYAIECGDDTMLLVFAPEHSHWVEKLLWQSPQYTDDRGAFGDFFFNAILPGKSPDDWRIIVAHGMPWCMSRFSGFGIDVLAPAPDNPQPRILWHTERGYSRGDFAPALKASGDTFEFRVHSDDMIFDPDNGYERAVIYRYRVDGTSVSRLEPIATTGRGFAEEWLSMPWPEAKDQTLPANSEVLQRIHQRYETSYPKDSNVYTSWTVGPVRSCSATNHFQITFDTQRNKMIPGKPGGEQDPPVPIYFLITQVPNGYQMQSASRAPDPTCTGPNLMSKPAAKHR